MYFDSKVCRTCSTSWKLHTTHSMPTSMGLPWLSLGPLVSGVASCGDASRIVVFSTSSLCTRIKQKLRHEYNGWGHSRTYQGEISIIRLLKPTGVTVAYESFRLLNFFFSFFTCWPSQGIPSSSSSSSHTGPSCISSENKSSAIVANSLLARTLLAYFFKLLVWMELLAPMWTHNKRNPLWWHMMAMPRAKSL